MKIEKYLPIVNTGLLAGILLVLVVNTYYLANLKVTQPIEQNPVLQLKTNDLPNVDNYDPKIGNGTNILIFEYTDYQCPFCARHNILTFPEIYDNYIKTGIATYYYKDFPLSFHKFAYPLAKFSNCIYKLYGANTFLQFKQWLFRNRDKWVNLNDEKELLEFLKNKTKEMFLDYKKILQCYNSTEIVNDINQDLSEITRYRFTGTPSFLIAINVEKLDISKIKNLLDYLDEIESYGIRIYKWRTKDNRYLLISFSGALPYNIFDKILSYGK